jgi:hypothetical protein
MGSNRRFAVPAQRHAAGDTRRDPVFAGIHALSCGSSASKTQMAGTSPAMTPEKVVR